VKKIITITFTIIALVFFLLGCAAADDFPADAVVEAEEADIDVMEEVTDDWEFEEEAVDEMEVGEPPVEDDGIHGLISRIEHGDNVVYIFGSMHYGRPQWYPLYGEVEAAMRRADAFVFETDLTPEGQQEAAPIIIEHMMLDNMTLSEFLDADAFDHLMAVAETYGLTYQAIRQFTPWVVSILMADVAYSQVGITATYGIDFYVMGFANAHGLPILYLNPIDHEINLAFNLTDELQHYAALSVESLDVATLLVERLVVAYETQNIEEITTLLRDSSITGEAPNPLEVYMIEVIIIQRSIEFAREIIRLLEETGEPTTFFVTMGIGHMVGDDYGNVFNYLRSSGFEVVELHP
jgi:uncharacterized protein YbaP (TraB family)